MPLNNVSRHRLIQIAIVSALVATAILLDMVAAQAMRGALVRFSEPTTILYLALVFAQITLITTWIVLGGPHRWLRLPVALFAMYHLALPLRGVGTSSDLSSMALLLVFGGLVGLPLWVLWLAIPRRTMDCAPVVTRLLWPNDPGTRQFNLAGLLAWTTFIAVALGLFRCLDVGRILPPDALVLLVAVAACTLIALTTPLFVRRPLVRIMNPCLVCPVLGAVAGQLTGPGIPPWSAAMVCSLSAGFVSAAVYALLNARSRDDLAPIPPIPCVEP